MPERDVSDVDRDWALLAAVRVAVGRYGVAPAATADERAATEGASC